MAYCTACGTVMPPMARLCPQCGVVAGPQPVVVVRDRKEPWFALALSFLYSGLGQIYNGELGKGVAFLVAHTVSIALLWVLVGFITTPIIWIWGMVDAYKSAERINFAHGIS